jgi:DNA-binding NarL/FixJ family response regulator
VIILSMYSDGEFLIRALSAGAKGYLLKDSAEPDLVRAVGAVSHGKTFFSPAIARRLLEDYVRRLQQEGLQDSYDLLTDREKEVLQLLAEGRSNKDVASLLNLSMHTVETHRTTSCRNSACTTRRKSCSTPCGKKLFLGASPGRFRSDVPGPRSILLRPEFGSRFRALLRLLR